ncbi:amino acid ABC transporter permease [Arthrobacter roseus]|uniref:amino acid ABC transporter permease n=1 Tax=Arthrobacter roseus TaxID=136274 RepID=UPI0030844C2D|nr:glutamate transport system permease protein [Arthrobacter roseus]
MGNVIGVLVIAAVLLYILNGLAEKDQLSAAKWSPFLEGDTWQYYILPGLLNTLKAAAVAILTSVVFGLALGLGRLSAFAPLRWITGTIVEFLRAVPVLLMMIFLWFGISMLDIMPAGNVPFVAVVTALTLYNGSVIAELVRSGVYGLPSGQREAALAIGMTRPQSLRSIEVPQALVAMLPALISQFVVILKDSALGYIITYSELLSTSRRLGSGEGNMLPALIVAAVIFIVINYSLSSMAQWLSRFLSFRAHKPVRKEEPLMDASNNAGVL